MPTGTSVASRRGEGKEIGTVDGIKVGFTTGFGTAPMPTSTPVASPRGEGGLWPVFGTGALPTGTSVPFPRGEGDFWTVFGTGTMPTSTPVASSRGEGGLLTGLRHGSHAHRYRRGIPAWRRGLLAGLRPVRRSAYSENAGIRCVRPAGLHIQRPGIRLTGPAPGIFSGPRHIQRVPGVSVALVDVAG